MPQRDENSPIETAAAVWASRVDSDGFTDQDQCELEKWLSENVLHSGAFERAQAGLNFFDVHFLEQVDVYLRALSFMSRRRA